MDTSKITNPIARAAFEAWQEKDLPRWLSYFTPKPLLFDDGNPRDFHAFSEEIGKERFTSIEAVENDGKKIIGQFHSEAWGDFKTYFKFSIDPQGKIDRLDIGQA